MTSGHFFDCLKKHPVVYLIRALAGGSRHPRAGVDPAVGQRADARGSRPAAGERRLIVYRAH